MFALCDTIIHCGFDFYHNYRRERSAPEKVLDAMFALSLALPSVTPIARRQVLQIVHRSALLQYPHRDPGESLHGRERQARSSGCQLGEGSPRVPRHAVGSPWCGIFFSRWVSQADLGLA